MHWERLAVATAIAAGALLTGLVLRASLSWLTRRAGRTR
jgi:hypothetical protein